jgi:magnesium transporter
MFKENSTVEEALVQLRTIKDRRVLDICLVDSDQQLIGLVPIQNFVQADLTVPLSSLVLGDPIRVPAMAPREDVVKLLEEQKLTSLPVVETDGRLLGVIRYDALVSAVQADASEDLQAMFGTGREEKALSKMTFAVKKRLPRLPINLGTAFLASFVVGLFKDTIAQLTALAIFLPVVAGQSGNTGSQALAVSMRGLALREIRARDWWRLMRKEAGVGFINGVAVATTTGLIVALWTGISSFGIVIGVSMVLSMVAAGTSGAMIPIILKSLGQDPAQSSSIILTTITDIVGFMSFLGLATLMMGMLTVN